MPPAHFASNEDARALSSLSGCGDAGQDPAEPALAPDVVTLGAQSATGAQVVVAGGSHALALRADGTVWAWGTNHSGQLGMPGPSRLPTPAQVPGLTGVIALAAGSDHSVALCSDGTVWAWGNTQLGEFAAVPTHVRTLPVQVPGLVGVIAVAVGERHALALCDDGTVWGWGHNAYGQLGNGTSHVMPAPSKPCFRPSNDQDPDPAM